MRFRYLGIVVLFFMFSLVSCVQASGDDEFKQAVSRALAPVKAFMAGKYHVNPKNIKEIDLGSTIGLNYSSPDPEVHIVIQQSSGLDSEMFFSPVPGLTFKSTKIKGYPAKEMSGNSGAITLEVLIKDGISASVSGYKPEALYEAADKIDYQALVDLAK